MRFPASSCKGREAATLTVMQAATQAISEAATQATNEAATQATNEAVSALKGRSSQYRWTKRQAPPNCQKS